MRRRKRKLERKLSSSLLELRERGGHDWEVKQTGRDSGPLLLTLESIPRVLGPLGIRVELQPGTNTHPFLCAICGVIEGRCDGAKHTAYYDAHDRGENPEPLWVDDDLRAGYHFLRGAKHGKARV